MIQRLPAAILALLVITVPCPAQERTPAPRPAEWGASRDGVSVMAALEGDVHAGGHFGMKVSLRNLGDGAVKLDGAFGWLLVVESRERAYFTAKVQLHAPAMLETGKSVEFPLDLSQVKVFAFQRGIKVVNGYPVAPEGEALKEVGTLSEALPVAMLRARWTVCIPAGQGVVSVPSAMLMFEMGPRAAGEMTAAQKNAYLNQLVDEFKKSAFAGQRAHGLAVKIGADALPVLSKALKDRSAPRYARLWMATAVCDIGGETGADEAISLLKDPDGGVRAVIAYHGPKMKNERLNRAILDAAEKGDGAFRAWAARGLAASGQPVSDRLVDAALASGEPLARAEIAETLAKRHDAKAIAGLVKLLGDDVEAVRGSAARAIGSSRHRERAIVAALVKALDDKGDGARQVICQALGKIRGQAMAYDPKATPAEKERVISAWKTWWAGAQAGWKE